MEWRKVKGFEQCYEIREDGLLKRLPISYYGKAPDGRDIIKRKGVFYPKQRIGRKGYLEVDLCLMDKGKKVARSIHRLVAEAFLSNFDKSLTVDHLDCDKQNNHYSNLECVTNAENLRRSHAYGTHSRIIPQEGKRVINDEQAKEIRRLYFLNDPNTKGTNIAKPYSHKKLAKIFKVSPPTIRSVLDVNSTYKNVGA